MLGCIESYGLTSGRIERCSFGQAMMEGYPTLEQDAQRTLESGGLHVLSPQLSRSEALLRVLTTFCRRLCRTSRWNCRCKKVSAFDFTGKHNSKSEDLCYVHFEEPDVRFFEEEVGIARTTDNVKKSEQRLRPSLLF